MTSQKAHQPLFVLQQHTSAVMTCALDAQGVFPHLLLSGDVDGIVNLWDLELRAVLLSFPAVQAARPAPQGEGKGSSYAAFANEGVLKVGFLAFRGFSDAATAEEGSLEVCFYTQCRNQHLYIWRATLGDGEGDSSLEGDTADVCRVSLELLHTINVPQHGFCTVPSVPLPSGEMQLAVPHDNDGVLSLWNVDGNAKEGTSREGLRVSCCQSFPAAGAGTKCGIIMCICYRDSEHLAVAFESGHVSLNNTRGERLAILRAFAETALACVWSGSTVLASSAEGQLHCYRVSDLSREKDGPTEDEGFSVSLTVQWEVSLRKGVGSLALQRHLAVVGSWDHTLRLYDEGSGRVITILTFHSGIVNEVAMAPLSAAQCASFGFDVRHPRWCGAQVPNSGRSSSTEDDSVYLFASAGKDFTIALWRVDFKVLRAVAVCSA
ncbi:hypothetical protein DQ04_04181030 [Trypanosoma grayi]|uniref:hypothetical protein n=1 Tax=Trypanosoma grayi TaxID=71804 RepID=UPI0004F4A495|nr:hypothetical protein DQ04_04181030 [Trypanosoma grayi]KEG10098.1 hypothetical protein DQ04_04181030 [Trypanosoma grayi]